MLYPEQWPTISDRLTADHFYDVRHRAIWGAMGTAWKLHGSFDITTLATVLGPNTVMAGGLSYLSSVSDHVTAMGASYYAAIVEDAYRRRSIYLATEQIRDSVGSAQCVTEALTALIDTARKMEEQHTAACNTSLRSALQEVFKHIEDCQRGRTGQIETGLARLDEALLISPPDLVVLAARPGQGKTALAMNISRNVLETGRAVGFVSLEMGRDQLLLRWLSMLSGVSVDRMRRRSGIQDHDYSTLTNAATRMTTWNLQIEDGVDKSIADIRQIARTWKQKHAIELLVVDYFQLLSGGDGKFSSREQEMAHCSRQLKALAKELHLPVLLLCQMNRELERRRTSKNPYPRPTMADLRETGQLEQDADIITFLHNDDEESDEDVSLIIAKQRQGRSGIDVPLRFVHHNQRFESA